MHEPDQHVSPIKNWKQLVVVVALAFIVPIAVIILLSQFVTDRPVDAGMDDTAVLNRIKPVGDVVLAAPSGPKGQLTGEQVYGQVCKTCHEAGLAGAPKVGDKTAWAKVIAQGQATAVDHAIKGIRAMPPKGGNPDFENVEVERAVVFMANQAGANWKAPAVEAPALVATSAPAAPLHPPLLPLPLRHLSPLRRLRRRTGQGRRQEDLRYDVLGVSRRGRGRRAQVRRQGRLGAAHQDRHRCALRERHQRQGRDAREGRQCVAAGCRREGGRRLHGRRRQVAGA